MSFNIRYGSANDGEDAWPLRHEALFGVIERHAPDILGVQEGLRFQLDEIGARFPAYAEIGVGRDDGLEAGEYAAILYRTARLTVLDSGTFWLSDTPGIPGSMTWGNRITRICTWARFRDRDSGETFFAYNLHLDHESQPSRERSTALLADRVAARNAPDPVIVLGDFNAGEDNPAVALLRERLKYRDTFRVIHPDAEYVGTFSAFRGDSTGEKIDYVFVSPAWRVRSAEIVRDRTDGRDPSDHVPVLARLAFPVDR